MAMKPEFKKVWVEALRSGEFKQGKQTLRNAEGEHCCLGVACVVWQRTLLPEIQITAQEDSLYAMRVSYSGGFPAGSTIPRSLVAAVGMECEDAQTLAVLNDESRKSFAEIADYIEANL